MLGSVVRSAGELSERLVGRGFVPKTMGSFRPFPGSLFKISASLFQQMLFAEILHDLPHGIATVLPGVGIGGLAQVTFMSARDLRRRVRSTRSVAVLSDVPAATVSTPPPTKPVLGSLTLAGQCAAQ